LIEDFSVLAILLMASAILSAVAIAISGLPLFVRIIAMVLAFFLGTSWVPGLAFMAFRSSGGGPSITFWSFSDPHWLLLWFDTAVLCAAALEIAAAAIAPPSENHAARQRLISYAALLPVPLLLLAKAPRDSALVGQFFFFQFLAGFTSWHQLAATPSPLHRHLEPFARRRPLGFFLAAFFQPGWPSAALYLLASVSVVFALFASWSSLPLDNIHTIGAALLLGAAAQLAPPLFWRAARRRARWPLLEYVIFQIVFGVVAIFMLTLKPDAFHYGQSRLWAAFPPLGVWLMLDDGLTGSDSKRWLIAGSVSFVTYFLVLQFFALDYWRRAWALYCEIRRTQTSPSAPVTGTAP
jgi:hypothetical protein